MLSNLPGTFGGLRVITSLWLTEDGDPVEVRRSWHERFLSRPWRPWRVTRTVIPQVPRRGALKIDNTLYFHPQTWRTLCESREGAHGD